jgi:hypothetical protein
LILTNRVLLLSVYLSEGLEVLYGQSPWFTIPTCYGSLS